MPCSITTAKGLDCKDSVGGIKALYLGDYNSGQSLGLTINADGTLDGLPLDLDLFRYDVRPQTSGLTTTLQSDAGGSAAFTTALEVTFHGLNQDANGSLETLIAGRFFCFVQDANDNVYALGLVNGCTVTGGTFVTGTARTDLSGYTLTIDASEATFPPAVIASADATSVLMPFDALNAGGAGTITLTPDPQA